VAQEPTAKRIMMPLFNLAFIRDETVLHGSDRIGFASEAALQGLPS